MAHARPKPRPQPHAVREEGRLALWRLLANEKGRPLRRGSAGATFHGPETGRTTATKWRSLARILEGRASWRADYPANFDQQEFTIEAWVSWPKMPTGRQVIFDRPIGQGGWRLELTRHLCLAFIWRDAEGREQVLKSVQMVDELRPRRWYHLAATFRNHCYTGQPYIQSYSRAEILFTPAGELFPRTVAMMRHFEHPQIAEGEGPLWIGRDAPGQSPFQGALCEVALSARAKLKNEFPTLGQKPPRSPTFSDDFDMGSVFCPVEAPDGRIVLGARPYLGHGNYWLYAQLDGCTGKQLAFEALAVPGGQGMLLAMWVSYDRKTWARIPGGHYQGDQLVPGSFTFSHKFKRSPAWLAACVPWSNTDTDRLAAELRGHKKVRLIEAATSVEGRPVRLFQVTDPNVPDYAKRTVYIQTGQHSPMEMMAGRSCASAIRYLLSPSSRRRALLQNFCFLFVPIVNVDCAAHGGSGHNAAGVNTNRDWADPQQPEVKGLKSFLRNWLDQGNSLDLALDIHAGGAWLNHALLLIPEQDTAQLRAGWYEDQLRFLACLDRHADVAEEDAVPHRLAETKFSDALPRQWGTPAFCLELSNMTYRSRADGGTKPVTQQHLELLGPQLVEAAIAFLEP